MSKVNRNPSNSTEQPGRQPCNILTQNSNSGRFSFPVEMGRLDQMRIIEEVKFLPGMCFAISMLAGDSAAVCLQRLEKTRAFFWEKLINHDTNLYHLREQHGDLANRFTILSSRLEYNTKTRKPEPLLDDVPGQNHGIGAQYNELINRYHSVQTGV